MVAKDIPAGYGPDDDIEDEGPDPVWLQLAAILQARIRRGDYSPRRVIPSIDQMVQEFGVARGTVRKSVGLLAELGMVRVVSGKGTFVAEQPGDAAEDTPGEQQP